MMLNSMDFFELRRTAARYTVVYQGVRRQKLVRDLERVILAKANPRQFLRSDMPEAMVTTVAASSPEGAVSAKPKLTQPTKSFGGTRINTFSTRSTLPRPRF
ncbi:MAG: hypothetical protein V1798_10845 [Pseudomonadota bacterium]